MELSSPRFKAAAVTAGFSLWFFIISSSIGLFSIEVFAIFVGTTLFGGGAFVIPAATYSLIMFATSLIFVFLVKNN